jgi:hypothetical protein
MVVWTSHVLAAIPFIVAAPSCLVTRHSFVLNVRKLFKRTFELGETILLRHSAKHNNTVENCPGVDSAGQSGRDYAFGSEYLITSMTVNVSKITR